MDEIKGKTEISDIYPVAFLICLGLKYEVRAENTIDRKRRIIFIFEDDVKPLIQKYYAGEEEKVLPSKYARTLKELKSLVHNY